MNCLKNRILTNNEKMMFKEVSKSYDISYLESRLDYIKTAIFVYIRYGLYRFKKFYPSMNFTLAEMRFYCELITERLKLLKIYRDQEEKIYSNLK